MKTRGSRRLLASLFCTLLLSSGTCVLAAHAGGDETHRAVPHGPHPWHTALFFGAAHASGHYEPALGADLEYRFGEWLGAGVVADAVLAEHPHVLVGGGLVLHPWGGLKLSALPGAAFEEGHRTFVLRAGVGYDLRLGPLSVTPTLNVDYADGHATQVAGLAVGLGF